MTINSSTGDVDVPTDRQRYFPRGLQTAQRPLELNRMHTRVLVQPRVLDRDSADRQHPDRLLVRLIELTTSLLVQINPHACPRTTIGTPKNVRISG